MARRSQCSSNEENPLDPHYLPPHYREEYRLAIDALIEEDLQGYYEYLSDVNVVDFLCFPEIEYIKSAVQEPQQTVKTDRRYVLGDGDGSSDTYWPTHSDLDAPELDLGWPQQHRFVGPTEITTLVNPSDPEMPSIKEQARRIIRSAQQVVAVAMDMFTDIDIFADLVDAAMRNVAVYVLLDELNAQHFVAMANNCRINLNEIDFMRVRTIPGSTYFCHTGKSFKGQMMNRFMLVDCRVVLSGNYSFMWSYEKIHRCIAQVFFGELVTTFDEEFRILYAQSEPLISNANTYVANYLEKQHNIENTYVFRKEYPSFKDNCQKWLSQSCNEHLNVGYKSMPLRKAEVVNRSTEDLLSHTINATQQLIGGQPFLKQIRQMRGPTTKEMDSFTRSAHTGGPGSYVYAEKNALNIGSYYNERLDVPSTNFPREVYFHEKHSPGYLIYAKPSDKGYSQYDQYSEPEFTSEKNAEELEDYDHVQRYLQSYSTIEEGPDENVFVPSKSASRRQSMRQGFASQISATKPNPPDQKHAFNLHNQKSEPKEGLRVWRINSYLSALRNTGQPDIEDLQSSDSCEDVLYVKQGMSEPDISTAMHKQNWFTKNLTFPEITETNIIPTNKGPTPPSASESSYTTECDNKEPKEANSFYEEFVKKKTNLALQKNSRLRHSLIFNCKQDQNIFEDKGDSIGQGDEQSLLKQSLVVSSFFKKKRPITKNPIQWTDFLKPSGFSASDSTQSEDFFSKLGKTEEKKDKTSQIQKIPQEETCIASQETQPQDSLADNSHAHFNFFVSGKSLPFLDMNDPECRLQFFKELAAKRKAEHASEKIPKETHDNLHTHSTNNMVEEKEPALKCNKKFPTTTDGISAIKPDFHQTELVSISENVKDPIAKQHAICLGPKEFNDFNRPQTNAFSDDQVMATTATDTEKLKHKNRPNIIKEDCDTNSALETGSPVNNPLMSASNPSQTNSVNIGATETQTLKNMSEKIALHFTPVKTDQAKHLASTNTLTSKHTIASQTGHCKNVIAPVFGHASPFQHASNTKANTIPTFLNISKTSTGTESFTFQYPSETKAAPSKQPSDTDIYYSPTFTGIMTSFTQTLSVSETDGTVDHTETQTGTLEHPTVMKTDPSQCVFVAKTDKHQHSPEICIGTAPFKHSNVIETGQSITKGVTETFKCVSVERTGNLEPSPETDTENLTGTLVKTDTFQGTGLSLQPTSMETATFQHSSSQEAKHCKNIFVTKVNSFQDTPEMDIYNLNEHVMEPKLSQHHSLTKTEPTKKPATTETCSYQNDCNPSLPVSDVVSDGSQCPSKTDSGNSKHSCLTETGSLTEARHPSLAVTELIQQYTAKETKKNHIYTEIETVPSHDSFDAKSSQVSTTTETDTLQHSTLLKTGLFPPQTDMALMETRLSQYSKDTMQEITASDFAAEKCLEDVSDSSNCSPETATETSKKHIRTLVTTGATSETGLSQQPTKMKISSFQHSSAHETCPFKHDSVTKTASSQDFTDSDTTSPSTVTNTGPSQHNYFAKTRLAQKTTKTETGSLENCFTDHSQHASAVMMDRSQHPPITDTGKTEPFKYPFSVKKVHIQKFTDMTTDSLQNQTTTDSLQHVTSAKADTAQNYSKIFTGMASVPSQNCSEEAGPLHQLNVTDDSTSIKTNVLSKKTDSSLDVTKKETGALGPLTELDTYVIANQTNISQYSPEVTIKQCTSLSQSPTATERDCSKEVFLEETDTLMSKHPCNTSMIIDVISETELSLQHTTMETDIFQHSSAQDSGSNNMSVTLTGNFQESPETDCGCLKYSSATETESFHQVCTTTMEPSLQITATETDTEHTSEVNIGNPEHSSVESCNYNTKAKMEHPFTLDSIVHILAPPLLEDTNEKFDLATSPSPKKCKNLDHNILLETNKVISTEYSSKDNTQSYSSLLSKSDSDLCSSSLSEYEDVIKKGRPRGTESQQQIEKVDSVSQETLSCNKCNEVSKIQENTEHLESFRCSHAELKAENCQTSSSNSANKQFPNSENVASSQQPVNLLSCSNLRDDTKILLEQISAKNQEKVNQIVDNVNDNVKLDKQGTVRQWTQTWSCKASPQEREELLQKMEKKRKEKIYSRFEYLDNIVDIAEDLENLPTSTSTSRHLADALIQSDLQKVPEKGTVNWLY